MSIALAGRLCNPETETLALAQVTTADWRFHDSVGDVEILETTEQPE
jgi:hypothetical protein